MVIDEVQMAPSLFRALKLAVDEARFRDKKQSNGRFLLTGSANITVLLELSDSLIGRMIDFHAGVNFQPKDFDRFRFET